MARNPFGGSSADFLFTASTGGLVRLSSGTLTFWDDEFGGTRYTDLLLNGAATASISVDADGQVPTFFGPDGVTQMWADAGGARVLMVSMSGVAETAQTARNEAQAAAAAAQAVGSTNDTIIAGRINDPASATATALSATIATESTETVQDLVPGEVAAAVSAHTPGSELALAERTTNFTATNVTPALALITGLSVVVTGAGRPVEVEVFLPRVYHSVSNGGVIAGIWGIKTGAAGAYVQLTEAKTPTTATYGQGVILRRRLVLPVGEEWTFIAYIGGLVAGTTTVVAAPGTYAVMPYISVVSR